MAVISAIPANRWLKFLALFRKQKTVESESHDCARVSLAPITTEAAARMVKSAPDSGQNLQMVRPERDFDEGDCSCDHRGKSEATRPCEDSFRVYPNKVRILVVEDEVKLAAHLARALEHDGHAPKVVYDGLVALTEARDGGYDLIILDVQLPRMDGFEILKQLRAWGVESRIVMLTARGETPDKITGLTAGADDYLTKPFAMNELLARVKALGRRHVAPPCRILRAGDLTLKIDDREAWRGDKRVELSERECAILSVLMREPGRTFSRAELSEHVWQREHEYDNKLVDVFISRLRKKIDGGSAEPWIKTVRHVGYAFREPTSS